MANNKSAGGKEGVEHTQQGGAAWFSIFHLIENDIVPPDKALGAC